MLNEKQKQANEDFFQMVIDRTNDGGYYLWPNESLMFEVRDGKLMGDKRGVDSIKRITTSKFHNKVVLK